VADNDSTSTDVTEESAQPGVTPTGETPEVVAPADPQTPEVEEAQAEEPEVQPEPEPEPEPEPVAAPEPEPSPEDLRPEEPKVGKRPAKGIGLMAAGGATLGAGLAWTIGFGLATRNCSYDGPLQCKLEDQDTLLIPMGVAMMTLGTILLGVGLGWHFRYKRWESWRPGQDDGKKRRRASTALAPATLRGGGGLVWTGRF
jgi:hypothetical protein